jgi:hypothetical protein
MTGQTRGVKSFGARPSRRFCLMSCIRLSFDRYNQQQFSNLTRALLFSALNLVC